MIKRFIKDNRGQVLYAVLVTIMFIGMLSMITMGLTLKNYNASLNKQQRVSDYYAADAVAEMLRIGVPEETAKSEWKDAIIGKVELEESRIVEYTITYGTVTIITSIDTENQKYTSWEVSYHAAEEPAE